MPKGAGSSRGEGEVAMGTQPANTGPASVAAAEVMEAIVQDLYGSADRLRLAQIERPVITVGEVLVQVRASTGARVI
jgi:hypothetical protein